MANLTKNLTYKGNVQPEQKDIESGEISPYLPSQELVQAVNLTLLLKRRPLLIRGEPGSGKTRLAQAVADELNLPFESWHVKSTSRARDGLYTYDAVGRLHDAQLIKATEDNSINLDPSKYVRWGPLGRAFKNDQPTVILIDEIDKADIDFPNDLLLELDEQRFVVEETEEKVRANHAPIVFITSNDEKELPDAFLRRCLFFYIEFPRPELLTDIVSAHFPNAEKELVSAVLERFIRLRGDMDKDKGKAGKKVSTSELLDWFTVLISQHPKEEVERQLKKETLPYAEVLLKSWEDHLRYS